MTIEVCIFNFNKFMLADLIMEKPSWMRGVSPPETFKILFLADLNIFVEVKGKGGNIFILKINVIII